MDSIKEVRFANLSFKGLNTDVLLEEEDFLKIILTVNAEFIVKANKNERFRNLINNNYATFDGQVTYYISKLFNLREKYEIISGCDFIYDVSEYCSVKGKRLFLLGGYEESNQRAVKVLRDKYNIEVEGYSPPYMPYPFSKEHNDNIIKKLESFKPHFIFVGFGALKQEFWIEDNYQILDNLGVKWAVGSGGTFEFVSNTIKLPPNFIKKAGLFSLYRLFQEPKSFRLKRILFSFGVLKYIFVNKKK